MAINSLAFSRFYREKAWFEFSCGRFFHGQGDDAGRRPCDSICSSFI